MRRLGVRFLPVALFIMKMTKKDKIWIIAWIIFIAGAGLLAFGIADYLDGIAIDFKTIAGIIMFVLGVVAITLIHNHQ